MVFVNFQFIRYRIFQIIFSNVLLFLRYPTNKQTMQQNGVIFNYILR